MEGFIKKLEELNLFLVKKDENLILRGLKRKLDEEDKNKIKNNKEIIDFIKKNKAELLEYLDTKSLIDSFYKLSPMQEGMLFHGLYDTDSKAYIEQMSLDFSKGLHVEALKSSWEYVMKNHSTLRTSFLYEELSIPLQCAYNEVKLPFIELDYSTYEGIEKEEKLEKFLTEDCEKGFSFNEVPLMRITLIKTGKDAYKMVFTHHHILMDGWSSAMLMEELLVAYEAFYKGEEPPQKKEDAFEDYIKYISKSDEQKEEVFWKTYISKLETSSILPFSESTTLRNKGIGNNEKLLLSLESDFTEHIKSYATEKRLTVNSIIQGVWALLLSRYTGNEEVVYGVTVSGRPTDLERSEQRLGLYINTLPLYTKIDNNVSIGEWLTSLQLDQVSCREYQYTSLAKIQSYSGVRGDLFDSILVFENYPVSEVLKKTNNVLQVDNITTKEQTNYLLTIAVNLGRELTIEFNYNDQLLDRSILEMIKGHFYTALKQIVTKSDADNVSEISILTKDEENKLLHQFNNPVKRPDKEETILSLFKEQVRENASEISLVFQDKKMTYKELDENSNQLANYLLSNYDINKEEFIGVKLERSDWLLVSMIAILKVGGAYLPIDPNYPEERIKYIEEDSQCKVFITPEVVQDFDKNRNQYAGDCPIINVQSNSLAYMIYTSGSTGRPKGVMIEHGSIVNTIVSQITNFSIGNSERCLQFSNQSFDASMWEILIALLGGAALYIIDENIKSDVDLVINFINENDITWATLPPAFVKLIAIEDIHSIKTLVTAGEEAPVEKAIAFSKKGKYVNAYGPTETSICATVYQGDITARIPIGTPIDNTRAYIVSDSMQLQPIGVIGELCFSGIGISRGYLNKESLTEDRFISDPFTSGLRLYKTGDLARWLSDGNIEFLGRKDDQVKIRGYRIELGEIESVLSELPSITSCCVVSRADGSGSNRLVGYVVSSDAIDKSSIQSHLKTRLPDYMIPGVWVTLEDMPLTSNGKIDKKSLPDPDMSDVSSSVYVAPQSAMEISLAEIWQELLGVPKVGIHDNFFELGGHSLLATRLVSMIRKRLEVEVSIREIFDNPMISGLVVCIEGGVGKVSLPSVVHEDKIGR
uniref:non-ribosomal peptide synthetase n=1 Tax=Aquimarina longa TaxID=1080221 RepID=UPI000AE9413C